jgi:hypothetical protein
MINGVAIVGLLIVGSGMLFGMVYLIAKAKGMV